MEFTQFDERIAEGMLGAATAAGGISAYLDFRHAELGPGRLIAEMDARTDLLTPFGNLHGGCLSAFVDHCLGVVFYPVIPKGAWVATTEFKLNLLTAVRAGTVSARSTIVSLTRRTAVVQVEVDNDGRPCALAQGTVLIVEPRRS